MEKFYTTIHKKSFEKCGN